MKDKKARVVQEPEKGSAVADQLPEAPGAAPTEEAPIEPRRAGKRDLKPRRGRFFIYLSLFLFVLLAGTALGVYWAIKPSVPEPGPDIQDIQVYVDAIQARSQFVVAETGSWFKGSYVVPADFLRVFRRDYSADFKVYVEISHYLDLSRLSEWKLSAEDGSIHIKTPPLRSMKPRIRTETFEISREVRSILVNEEDAKLKLFQSLGPRIEASVLSLLDIGQIKAKAAESVARLVAELAVKSGGPSANVIVEIGGYAPPAPSAAP